MNEKNHIKQISFDPEILEIEEDLVNFLVDGMIKYSGRDPILSRTMTYFFTRKNLTQKELQKLTSYSAGTISKTTRQLLDLNLIEKSFIPGTHKHLYRMEELPYAKPSYLMNVENLLGGISVKLENLKGKLKGIKTYQDELDGFEKVELILNQLLTIIKSVPQFVEILNTELKGYLQKYPQFTSF
ncbi:MAG: hypothetical protein JW776_08435 [Candidatus Lokiarchaeota archaeon]|nr:hypothetical protein [Candidatus Lokiarchaeota archaeon]